MLRRRADGIMERSCLESLAMPDLTGPVLIHYTNHRGETAYRRIQPISLLWRESEWHPEPQWILTADDLDKRDVRSFAMKDIHSWRPLPMPPPPQHGIPNQPVPTTPPSLADRLEYLVRNTDTDSVALLSRLVTDLAACCRELADQQQAEARLLREIASSLALRCDGLAERVEALTADRATLRRNVRMFEDAFGTRQQPPPNG